MSMYKLKPVFDGGLEVDVPTCMYRLANVHEPPGSSSSSSSGCVSAHAHQNRELDPAVRALELRQDEIMRKLLALKAAVDGLAKTVATPDADLDLTVSSSLASPLPCPGAGTHPFSGTADLDKLLGKDMGALRDIVINANPAQPPLTLLVLHGLLCQRYRVLSSVHVHSSVPAVPPSLHSCLGPRHSDGCARNLFQLGFTLIWKDVPKLQMKFSVRSMCPIEGEANVARFLFRLLSPEPSDAAVATLVDDWVDTAFFQLGAEGGTKEQAAALRSLNAALGRHPWLVGPELTLADVACYCCTLQGGVVATAAPANVQRWMKACENMSYFSRAKLQ